MLAIARFHQKHHGNRRASPYARLSLMASQTIGASLPHPTACSCNEIITISFLDAILPLIERRFVQKPERLVEPQPGRGPAAKAW
jgi:hypothetical protein